MSALFVIFMAAPAGLTIFCLGFLCAGSRYLAFMSIMETVAAFFLHFSLACAYIQSYPPAQAESPSLEILIAIARRMPQGMAREDIVKHFDNRKLITTRFQDLINNNLMVEKNSSFSLTPTAKWIVRFFILYRQALGLQVKGG